MDKETLKIDVNSSIIEWAIKSSGWEIKDFLSKNNISEEVYKRWIDNQDKPTLNKIRLISEKTKRPIAIFLLEKIPEEKSLPKDFRLNPKKEGKFEKKTILAIRKSRKLQYILKDLGENYLGELFKEIKVNIEESPQKMALALREKFGITEDIQRKTKDSYQFYRLLREKLEKEKIFNFQISMPLEDARGFALSDDFPRVVVVNSRDIVEARIFTLIHELGHILLGDTEISIPNFGDTNKHEKWCNEFSSSFLLPIELAKRIFSENDKNLTEYETLNKISKKYKVSKSMLLYNMVKLNFISPEDYEEIVKRYTKKEASGKTKAGGAGVPAEKRCLNELGNAFISIVADNLDKKTITYSDALDYLSIKSRSFEKLLNKL